ncbi:hypothetical protein A4249_06130 [Brevundimonas sp. GW460-12-10-14-LB2]|uniref:hypothetical protein n=1 Tax=unclassified Brevundimonas TaxID=2622653 RepID=UPI0007BCA8CE|nr:MULTISPECIES: hypothetical protein [unclassified Brevundimonas]ANC53270.1 hypothetical protein A4249_06130 [Brevundimonas sp. GW460-12-10-14-LB2]MEA3474421.1 hypothetical protein [Pseudomonadota bacterium]QIF81790.1 hypothetical protein E4341_08785 [Brevundimonas sp. 'scallop']
MKIVQSLLLLFGALSVLALGAVGASASPATAAPCHQTGHETGQSSPDQTPNHTPKAMKTMICCVACVATPTLDPAPMSGPTLSPSRVAAVPSAFPTGQLLTPEPGPPRLLIV